LLRSLREEKLANPLLARTGESFRVPAFELQAERPGDEKTAFLLSNVFPRIFVALTEARQIEELSEFVSTDVAI
jgi:hypothetical protein